MTLSQNPRWTPIFEKEEWHSLRRLPFFGTFCCVLGLLFINVAVFDFRQNQYYPPIISIANKVAEQFALTVRYAYNPQRTDLGVEISSGGGRTGNFVHGGSATRSSMCGVSMTCITKVSQSNVGESVDPSRKRGKHVVIGTVKDTFIGSLQGYKIPRSVVAEALKLLSSEVDYRRDISHGTEFKILYTIDSKQVPQVTYIGLFFNQNKKVEMFQYKNGKRAGYYHANGVRVGKPVDQFRAPVVHSVLASGFGVRYHPIYGRARFHYGVDYKARRGDVVSASKAGVIEEVGYNRGHGKFIKIRHDAAYQTLYAHLERFGNGIHIGSIVKQGQPIGFVGSTGLATGAHLHYELHKNGVRVNPVIYASSADTSLSGKQLVAFQVQKKAVDKVIGAYKKEIVVASNLTSRTVDTHKNKVPHLTISNTH